MHDSEAAPKCLPLYLSINLSSGLHWKDTLPDWYINEYGYQPNLNSGTAGHVDRGKTTLVEAITGVWTSAHSEELRRGITISVGYADAAFYKCPQCPPPDCYSTNPSCARCGGKSELLRVVSFVTRLATKA